MQTVKNKITTLILLSFILNGFVGVAHAGSVDEALDAAFGGANTTQAPADPVVVAKSVADRAVLVQKYTSELRASNPNLSDDAVYAAASSRADSDIASSTPVDTLVSEKVPGATCTCATKGFEGQEDCPAEVKVEERLYQCSVGKGMSSFQNIIRDITKWFVYITMLLGVLALAGAGILWAWGSESEEYTKKAKGWAINIIIGLALLFTFRYILGFLAPWVFM